MINISALKMIEQMEKKFADKLLVQIEGATFSGKSTFISDFKKKMKNEKQNIMIIEEAAAIIFKKNPDLFNGLDNHSKTSILWRRNKIMLQEKILIEQLESLKLFAENDDFRFAIMDRGGASTAYHTLPFLSEKEILVEALCKKITKLANKILLFSPLQYFNSVEPLVTNSFPRYKGSLREINLEYNGIIYYLDKWKSNFVDVSIVKKSSRFNFSLNCIFETFFSQMEN